MPGRRVAKRLWPFVAALVVLAAPAPTPAVAGADADLSRAIRQFTLDAARRIKSDGDTAYLIETGTATRTEAPDVSLKQPASAFTDCSGWVSFVLSSVSPLHQSVVARQRLLPAFNHDGLDEASYAWPRAAVIRSFLASQPSDPDKAAEGFRRVTDYRKLAPGDIVAWCLGGWCHPETLDAPPIGDTGHTFVVVEPPVKISSNAPDYDGLDGDGVPTLDNGKGGRVASVIALGIVDASDIPHFSDHRDYANVPRNAPKDARAGGVGRGRIWIAIDETGAPVQFRFSRADPYFPNTAAPQKVGFAAGRPVDTIHLHGDLTVARYPNAVDRLGGQTYGLPPVALAGRGTVKIAAGTKVGLAGTSRFHGAVVVKPEARLTVETDAALGARANTVRLEGRLVLADGFSGPAQRTLRAQEGAVLSTPGRAVWRGPLKGRRLEVVARDKLTLKRIGVTVRGRKSVDLRK